MASSIVEIAQTVEKEAKDKYNSKNLLENLQSYTPQVFMEIVEYFKQQNELHPHLEAYEIYLVIEENLPSKNPSKEDIQKAIDGLLNVDEA
jgi:hypothetical protein